MSQTACAEFLSKLNTDVALATEVDAALEGKEGKEAANVFVWLGAKHGYEFTAETALQTCQEIG